MTGLTLAEGIDRLESRARVAQIVVSVTIAGYAAMTVTGVLEYFRMVDYEAAQLSLLSMIAVGAGLIQVTAFLASIVVVAMWINRAHANLTEAGYVKQFTPGWAVGWFFIPIANLFQPFRAMRELWNLSHCEPDSPHDVAAPQLSVWWGAWIVGSVLSNFGSREVSGEARFELLVGCAGSVALGICAWYLRTIILQVTAAQRSMVGVADTFA